MARMRMLAGAFIFVLFVLPNVAVANKHPQPPTLENLVGIWIGHSAEGGLEYLRLELDGAGTGILAVSLLPDTEVHAYYVRATSLDGKKVSFELTPVDSTSEPIALRGDFEYSYIRLRLSGVEHGWKRDVQLRNAAQFMDRVKALEERANRVPRLASPN